MTATLYLFACALATTQVGPADADGLLGPRLSRGQELVYRGSYVEETKGQAVACDRTFRMEARLFVLDTSPKGTDVVFMTLWKGRPSHADAGGNTETTSARLEPAHLDVQGRVIPRVAEAFTVPLDSPPIIESGLFVEAPPGRIRPDQIWQVAEPGGQPRTWQVSGTEAVSGTRCLKLIGVQQSGDWDRPRADRTAWRRTDTVWLAPRTGYACQVDRVIERREPSRREPTQKSIMHYELESTMQYPGQLYDDRRQEIFQAQSFASSVAALLPQASQVGPGPFDAILKHMQYHYDRHPPTPYREAIRHIQRLAEAGKRGEVPAQHAMGGATPVPLTILTLDRPAPDFLVPDLVTNEAARLSRWVGRPLLLVFYNPAAASATEVLRFAQDIQAAYPEQVTVLGLAVSEDTALALKQREDLQIKFPLLSGSGLRRGYEVESTPKFVVLDSAGVMRGSYIGWGPEIPHSVTDDLKRCLDAPR